ncbi:Tetratricopeptide-like helical [Hirsutella rhossiliensis]|uniref:Tetratricopeptide-like helical n=1 Tax=Hirsutella rhossiliensis TaxID=111463 RepID=A0A9P8SFJ8_9HYPO|nr:Tetratricopeptide-like helical [Hirsutella rhossiliensis]KAH0960109.1 Tetratricopeptide-like helical [Hirsutella rhossiliensis]
MPDVVSPSPRRVTPQIPQNMQDDLQRLELDPKGKETSNTTDAASRRELHSLSTRSRADQAADLPQSQSNPAADADHRAYQNNDSRARRLDSMDREAPSFSPFPKVTGDNVPPADDAKEGILWTARKHVLHSQNVSMQISWARDVLTWVDIAADAAAREHSDKARPATPRIEHELREDAMNIINYLAHQAHPDALYIQAKWLEFGKFGHRVDKREAYSGYKRAAELGHARSEYRLGMLFEQSNDMSKAKEHYYKGMSLKDSAALYRMGMMSLLGQHGETKDYPRGLERIQAAADSADEDAPQGSYVYGMLVGRDLPDITLPDGLLLFSLDTAKVFVEKAAYLGFAKAQLKMGQAYELCQLGCDFNPSYSLHYYGLAAKQGLPEAALGVSRWFLFGYEGVFKKNEELAFKYAQEAAVAKLPTGEFALGYYYEIGIHVNKSIPDARKWYQQAADHGNKDAVGRLESLSQDKSLSKKDHETTTLTRIKSQHGSQRGKRPERFKQPQQLPTLSEGSGPLPGKSSSTSDSPRVSPQPSPGFRPTIVSESMSFPDPSRASVVDGSDRQPAFSLRLETGGAQPPRPHSAAPYPDDDQSTLTVHRSRSTAPYPEDDGRGAHNARHNQGVHSPQADRPMSAFGIRAQAAGPRPMPMSHSVGSLQPQPSPPPGGRVVSAGYSSPGGYRQPSPGPGHAPGRPFPGDDFQGRSASAQPYPNNAAGSRIQKQPLRQQHDMAHYHDPRASPQNHERFSRDPQRPTRVSSGLGQGPPSSPRPGMGGMGRTGSAPPGQGGPGQPVPGLQSSATAPSKPSKGPPAKGPATFEDMGIPQGKQEGDCVVM